jgi:proteasome assembly chaperone (PAC2) family protein
MNALFEVWDRPSVGKYMIAGWHQWADAGAISSGLPQYLIDKMHAKRIGRIRPGGFYLFQLPGAHHFLRPVVTLEEGHRKRLQQKRNEFFCPAEAETEMAFEKGFLIFLGEEPHQNEEQYAKAFLDAVQNLGVERVAAVAGVYGSVPYNKDRDISCVYSLPGMKDELSRYAIRFSDYEGGATISTYIADKAEQRGIEFFALYGFVPSYDFSTESMAVHPIVIEEDYKAWYDMMRRLDHMFDLGIDLSDLERKSAELSSTWDSKIEQLANTMPELKVKDYIENVNADFTETSFVPLSNVWEEALRDIFEEDEEGEDQEA